MAKINKEIWKPIPGHENRYDASTTGQVASRWGDKRKVIKYWLNWNGYALIDLRKKKIALHRVIALTFHGPCPEGLECCHLNGNKLDNRPVNLKYVTRKENHSHKVSHGTAQRGERNPKAKLTAKDVLFIRKLREKGVLLNDIARMYSISFSHVSGIAYRKTWTHI